LRFLRALQHASSLQNRSLPALARVEHTQFASERERLLAEADEGATQDRMAEMSFDFAW